MAGDVTAPFSARNRGVHVRIDNDFPESARIGLLHLLGDLVDKNYIGSWPEVAKELQRIARLERTTYVQDKTAKSESKTILLEFLQWEQVYDFCERVYGRLARADGYSDNNNEFVERTSRAEAQQYIGAEMQLLFVEEGLAFEFRDGIVQRRGRRHTIDRISKAEVVLGDPKLEKARKHYEKALRYFRDSKKPDPQNAVKEAVCAVEAAAKALFSQTKGSTLDDVIKAISGSDDGQIPKTIAKVFMGLYGFRGSGDGVAHGAAEGGPVTNEITEFTLAVAASQIILLVDLASAQKPDIPF